MQDLSLFVPSSNPNTVTLVNSQLVCSRKFGILNLAYHNVNRWFTANGFTPVRPASSLFFFFFFLMSFSKTQSFFFFYAFSFILLYVAVPSPPENVTVISKTSRLVNISWTTSFNGNSDIYTVEISTDNQTFTEARCQGLSSGGCVVSSSFTSASLVDLHPGRTYYIRVFATNRVGFSSLSLVITTTTDKEGTC